MKLLFTLSFFLSVSCLSKAAIKTAVGNSGQGWSVASNWSPAVVPQNGDTVIIPVGITMGVKTNIYNNTPNLVIRVYGTLSFSSGGKLNLGNNSKIFVYVGGTIRPNGTPSEVIEIGGVTKYKGNVDGIIVGPAYSDRVSGASPSGFQEHVLPVSFVSFTAKLNSQRYTQLTWTVSDETGIDHYIVEKSTNHQNWKTVSTLQSSATSLTAYNYFATDSFPAAGTTFYRIKAKGFAGDISYSTTEQVEYRPAKNLSVYPNPVSSRMFIHLDALTFQGKITVTFYSATGTQTARYFFKRSATDLELNIAHLPKGNYRVVVMDEHSSKQDQQVILY